MPRERTQQTPVALRRLTTLGVGGEPALYLRPSNGEQLAEALAECRRRGLRWRVIGGGSNLLVEGGPLPCAVLHVQSPGFHFLRADGARLHAGAGTATAALAAFCRRRGLGGAEWLAGLPGTLGGAVAGNAGAWGHHISEILTRVRLIDAEGRARTLSRDELDFSYRRCGLRGVVLTEVEVQMQPRPPAQVARRTADYARRRAESQPLSSASAGCIFKNPPGECAGRLIDRCGLKGCRVGDAEVSGRHANFVINRGRATAADVLRLIDRMRNKVLKRFGVELELEVRHWLAGPRAA
ncbi:MAG: UDP-N-acetylmuramate dehydrogenase [Planctomycetota bacterium]